MAGIFEIAKTNFIGYFDPLRCPVERFRPWIIFMNEHSLVRNAITLNAPLQVDALRTLYTTARNRTVEARVQFSFRIGENEYMVTEDDVNRILVFPTENHEDLPTTPEMFKFFQDILYQAEINLVRLTRGKLIGEWDYFFDTLAKVFAPTKKNNFSYISSLLQNIGYAVAHNRRINFGKLILTEIIGKMGTPESRDLNVDQRVSCYYPRFLMLIMNDKLTDKDKALFKNSRAEKSPTSQKNLFTRLRNQNKFPGVAVVRTPHMAQILDQAANLPPAQPEQPEPEPEQLPSEVEKPEQPEQLLLEAARLAEKEAQEIGYGPENTQVQTQAVEPQTVSSSTSTSQLRRRRKPVRKIGGRMQEGTMSEPAALSPPQKRLRIEPETTAAPSVSSQQDMDFEMPIQQSLDSFPPQDDSIEIRRPATVSCEESSTLLAGPPIIQDTQREESTVPEHRNVFKNIPLDSTFSVDKVVLQAVHNPMPLQASEGQFVSSPPMTSFEGAMVIFDAGTARRAGYELNTSVVRQTPSDTHARDESETNRSASEVSAHTHDELLLKMEALQKEMQIVQAELAQVNAQAEINSTSASVTEQLTIVRNEVNDVKSSILLKTKDIQDVQSLIAEDMKEIRDVNERIDEVEKSFNQRIIENEEISTKRFNKLDQEMLHLNEGMKQVYQTMEKFAKSFQASKAVEDPSTKGERVAEIKEIMEKVAEKTGMVEKEAGRDKVGEGAKDQYVSKESNIPDKLFYPEDHFVEDDGGADDTINKDYCRAEEERTFDDKFLFPREDQSDPAYEEAIRKLREDIKVSDAKFNQLQLLVKEKAMAERKVSMEMQKIWATAVKEKKRDVQLKLGASWDAARKIMDKEQKGPF